jgi:hypothetical protein
LGHHCVTRIGESLIASCAFALSTSDNGASNCTSRMSRSSANPMPSADNTPREDGSAPHAQRLSHQTGVLLHQTLQGVIGHIMAALNADFLDRIGYVVCGDGQETFGCVFNGAWRFTVVSATSAARRKFARTISRSGSSPPIPKTWSGVQFTQKHVGNPDRQQAATAITRRVGLAPTFRANLKPTVRKTANRPATRRNRVNIHHRRAHPHPRLGFS